MAFSNKSDKKGFGFEYTVSSMFQSQGYLTRRGIPLQYGVANQDATDIDVLGIMFTFPFQGHKIICDCKNKVKSKPYERIFWAKGLGEFVKASKVFVALNKTQGDIIRFANTGGVKILTSDIIADYATSKPTYGLADASYYEQYENLIGKVVKFHGYIQHIYSNVSKLYLNENPYQTLNIALAYLEELSKMLEFHVKNTIELNATIKYLICELTVIVAIQLLWICSDVLGLPNSTRREHITSKLTFGELEPNTVKSIMQDAKDLANEIVKSSIPKSVAPKEVDFGEITPPPYTDSLIGLVERALARPQMYLTMPQLLDYMLFEEGLKGKKHTDEEFKSIFGYDTSDDRMKASRNIISFVREFTGVDWKVVWENKFPTREQKISATSIENTIIVKEKSVQENADNNPSIKKQITEPEQEQLSIEEIEGLYNKKS
ncbi:hypothetical protein CN481_16760 [Bacillus sp. AFS006103]|nr:hypothetical protein CN481_16760 [Bacillus sp. AFS006103]